MIKRLNNRGQGMSTSTIVLLILGLIILVVLALGFFMAWNKLAPWLEKNNIDQVKANCNIACSTGSQYDFCAKNQTVNDGNNKKFDETCYGLATKQEYLDRFYGIASCPSVECTASE